MCCVHVLSGVVCNAERIFTVTFLQAVSITHPTLYGVIASLSNHRYNMKLAAGLEETINLTQSEPMANDYIFWLDV